MTAPDLTALADKLDELERSLDTIEDETCEGEDWMDYAGWEERYKARVSEAQDAFIHAARVALPQITTALREAARLREALEKIANHATGGVGGNPAGFVQFARAALESPRV